MKHTLHIVVSLFVLVGLVSCEEDFGTFNKDNRPEVPVMFANATTFGHDPYVEVTQGETIEFVLEIPENSGRTITEIRKVAAGGTAINIATLNNAASYIEAPIPGSGNSVVFTTTLEEFREKRPTTTVTVPESGFVEIAFLFEVILDNNESIVSMRARARISK